MDIQQPATPAESRKAPIVVGSGDWLDPTERITILSLGAGVQSTTLALMAEHGEIEKPVAAIFADTQAEPESVYRHLDWLESKLSYPVYRVTAGNLMDDSVRIRTSKLSGKKYMKGAIPAFVLKPDGGKGLLGRQCTADYKIRVLTQKARTLCDWKRGEKRGLVNLWIGISRDEIIRMKPSREAWIEHSWPLIDMNVTRQGCLNWMKAHGYPEPPRSACVFCPFHSDAEWTRLKTQEPAEFARAVAYEKRLQEAGRNQEILKGIPYLHDSMQSLETVEFENRPSHPQLDLWGNECEGMCGV